jgi:hypothetical protein
MGPPSIGESRIEGTVEPADCGEFRIRANDHLEFS